MLKRRAGDPSFTAMCKLGAAASKSSLAAATRGAVLPSWDTTWEFVRVLAVDQLGGDREDTHREWLARWTAAGAAAPSATAPNAPAPNGPATDDPTPPPADRPGRRRSSLRPTRGQAIAAGAVTMIVAAGIGSLAAASPPASGQTHTTQVDDASFIRDATFPDGSVVAPGKTFTKAWQLRNNGSVRWEGRYLTRMNSTACQAPDMVPIPATDPGKPVLIQVPVTASESPAHCKIYWKMTDAGKRLLMPGKNPIFLDVVVRDHT
jgi:hypothetical protein